MSRTVSTVFGLGYLRPAPGTWASLAAVLAGWCIDRYLGFPALVLAALIAVLAGFWAVNRALIGAQNQDPSEFVIDEVAGQWIALIFPAAAFFARGWEGFLPYPAPLYAFVLFRIFDIWKPWIIGRADAQKGAVGVMLDDILAGVFAGIATVLAAALYHLVIL